MAARASRLLLLLLVSLAAAGIVGEAIGGLVAPPTGPRVRQMVDGVRRLRRHGPKPHRNSETAAGMDAPVDLQTDGDFHVDPEDVDVHYPEEPRHEHLSLQKRHHLADNPAIGVKPARWKPMRLLPATDDDITDAMSDSDTTGVKMIALLKRYEPFSKKHVRAHLDNFVTFSMARKGGASATSMWNEKYANEILRLLQSRL